MPVQWQASAAGGQIQLSAGGAVTTRINSIANTQGIFPWLVMDSNVPQVSDSSLPPLRPLDENDVLVANLLDNNAQAGDLFPNHRVIAIHLDAKDMIGPPMAWQSVDAILLTPEQLAGISLLTRFDLLAEGIELDVLTNAEPDLYSPWVRRGAWEVESIGLKMPPAVAPEAYAPTEGWTTGRSADSRRRIFLFAAIDCLLVCGIALWRSRWTVPTIVAASGIAIVFFAIENGNESPVYRQTGTILLTGPTHLQDTWLYQLSHRSADFHESLSGSVHPVLSDLAQLSSLNLALECDGTGNPIAITGHLPPDNPLALMRRQFVIETGNPGASSPVTTPLRFLATQSLYPDCSILGQLNHSTSPESWPTLILDHK